MCQKRLAFHDGGIYENVGKGDPQFLFQFHPCFAQCNFPFDSSNPIRNDGGGCRSRQWWNLTFVEVDSGQAFDLVVGWHPRGVQRNHVDVVSELPPRDSMRFNVNGATLTGAMAG